MSVVHKGSLRLVLKILVLTIAQIDEPNVKKSMMKQLFDIYGQTSYQDRIKAVNTTNVSRTLRMIYLSKSGLKRVDLVDEREVMIDKEAIKKMKSHLELAKTFIEPDELCAIVVLVVIIGVVD